MSTNQNTESQQRIYGFLESNPIGVLATVDPNNRPHAVVVYYSIDTMFNIYFVTKTKTKKSDNLRHNAAANFLVYDATSQTTVQIYGHADEVNDPARLEEVFKNLTTASMDTSSEGVPPITKLKAGEYIVYRIKPAQVRMAVYARPDRGGYEDLFEVLEDGELKALAKSD